MPATMQEPEVKDVTVLPPARKPKSDWRAPQPSPPLMRVLNAVSRWLLFGVPVLRRIPVIRDLPFIHGHFWVRSIDLPASDRATLCAAVNPGTVAFMGPNHPEFGTDWLIDKELSNVASPRMASWADRGIVATAPSFWGKNNLIANDGGEHAKEYSVAWAGKGEGVLLHPEGSVRWTNDAVQSLYPGIAQMALKATERFDKPIYIVPIVWKYHYIRDISARLIREMATIERALGVAVGDSLSVAQRFHALQSNVLERQARHFGFRSDSNADAFFARQRAFQQWLVAQLEARHHVDPTIDLDKRIARLASTIRRQLTPLKSGHGSAVDELRARLKHDLAMAEEAKRLGEFSADVYGTDMLSQEQISESLKRMRDRVMRKGWKNVISNMLPRPLGPRVVHVAVPKPVRVMPNEAPTLGDYERRLLVLARMRMQRALDEINERIAPEVRRFAHVNPFVQH